MIQAIKVIFSTECVWNYETRYQVHVFKCYFLFRYSLAGKALHQLALIYAALVAFAQKSDFEVKVHDCKAF